MDLVADKEAGGGRGNIGKLGVVQPMTTRLGFCRIPAHLLQPMRQIMLLALALQPNICKTVVL